MRESVALPVWESSQVGEARRIAIALTHRLNFSETQRGKIGIIVTELANNLVKHARDGVILLQAIEKQQVLGLEILSIDKGPGIRNLSECLQDGFSTAGTPGNGLGAIARLSDFFDVYSQPDIGTAIVSYVWASTPPDQSDSSYEVGVVCLPKAGEEVSGDSWAVMFSPHQNLVLVADGLGHGPLAAKASLEAVRVFQEHSQRSPHEILAAIHDELRSTRGAAVAIAEINAEQQSIRYAGVGNIAGSVFLLENSYNMVSHNGTVGHEVRKIQEFTYQWQPPGLLIMHSDGLGSQWRLERYPGLNHKHPSLIAGILYRDFNRARDDVTVLVVRAEQV